MGVRLRWLEITGLLVAMSSASFAGLVVVDGDQDVSNGVLRAGGGSCCTTSACQANFRLDNSGSETLRDIGFSITDLTGPGGVVPSAAIRFHPASLPKLGAEGTKVVSVSLDLPSLLPGGDYHGVIAITADGGAVRTELPVVVVVCAAPASLRVVPLVGDHDGVRVTLAAVAGCAGTAFTGHFEVEADGGMKLAAVVPSVSLLPAGAVAAFTPQSLALAPGERGQFALTIVVPASLGAGGYDGLIALADAATGAGASSLLGFARCSPSTPSLRIAKPEELHLAPSTDAGCAGVGFAGEVRVENLGDSELSEVALHVAGFPAGFVVRVSPPTVVIAAGETGTFTLAVELPPLTPASPYRASLYARDDGTGASDEAVLPLERCATSDRRSDPPIVVELPATLSQLVLGHTASRGAARHGEVVSLHTVVKNLGNGSLRDVRLEQQLPPGLSFVSGRSAIDGIASEDPEVRAGSLIWSIAYLRPAQEVELGFQVVVSARARSGATVSRAYLRTAIGDVGPADATLEIGVGSRFELGVVVGEVRLADGSPVLGARVLLDSAREAITDHGGSFRFEGLAGGDHLVSLDPRSVGRGAHARQGDARLFHLFRGSTERIMFEVIPPPVLFLSLERLDADETLEGRYEP